MRKARWDEYIKTPVSYFRHRDSFNWLTYTVGFHWRRFFDRYVRHVLSDQRGTRLKGTILDEPNTLGGWDKKLRRKR